MRGEKDSGTLDMIPAKRGRPVLHPDRGPMTAAEKQRRYRELRKARAGAIAHHAPRALNPAADHYLDVAFELSDAVLLDAIRKEADFLQRLVTQGGRGTAPSRKRIGALVAELAHRYPQK